jgi:preprotein translocase subunit SecD
VPRPTLLSSRLVRRLLPLLILLLGAIALYCDFWPGAKFFLLSDINAGPNAALETKEGLDITGGFELVYQAVDPTTRQPVDPGSSAMDTIRSIVENRVNTTGVAEPIIETVGANEILVQVPGATSKKDIEDLVHQAGDLEFVLLPQSQYGTGAVGSTQAAVPGSKSVPGDGTAMDPALLATAEFHGRDLDPGQIKPQIVPNSANNWQIAFGFNSSVAGSFETWTGQNVGGYMCIVLDGTIQSCPVIQSTLTGGSGVITGSFNHDQATQLATILSYGALPYPLQEISSDTVPATLGASFLNQTLFAGLIGVLLVAAFMMIYYRLPGMIAVLALSYYGVAVLAEFRIVPVTLTLAGIAGFVLSVGMAVDANILIFERTKEELRTGKTLATAMEAGFNRAWNSILDSNVSSLITASILYLGGSSTIKGFALVLILGVATSMFTAVTVSRTLLRLVVHQGFAQRAWLWGVTDEEFQARATNARYSRREARGRV